MLRRYLRSRFSDGRGAGPRSSHLPRRVLVVSFVCALLVPITQLTPQTPARAAGGQIWASYIEVDAKSDAAITGANKCADIPMQRIAPFDIDEEDRVPGPQKNGACSFVSAHYRHGGVDMPVASLVIEGEGEEAQVVVTPEVPEYLVQTQSQVRLTIPLATLAAEPASPDEARIVLHYADASTFRRVSLALAADSTTEPGQSQPDINLDGTPFTASRRMFLYRETRNGKDVFARTVDIDVPRLRELTWNKGSDARSQKLYFAETADTSTKYRTQKKYDIVFDGMVNDGVTLSATLLSRKFDRVNMHGDLHIDADMYQEVMADVGTAEPSLIKAQDCGSGPDSCATKFYDTIQEPFFYKVTSSLNRDINARKQADTTDKWKVAPDEYDQIYRRTEILTPAIHGAGDAESKAGVGTAKSYLFEKPRAGYRTDGSGRFRDISGLFEHAKPRLVDFTAVAPRPVTDRAGRSVNDVHMHDAVASEWPTFPVNGLGGEGVPAEFSVGPAELHDFQVGQNYADDPYGNKQSSVSFYIQFNGVPNARSRLSDTRYWHWSYFLSRIGINGEWLDVPFPPFPAKPYEPVTDGVSCYTPTWNTDGCTTDPGFTYMKDRYERILGNGVVEGKIGADIWLDADRDIFLYAQPFGPVRGGTDRGKGRFYDQYVVKPRHMRSYEFTHGVNAGMKVDVELVNARVQGDLLADGFSAMTATDDQFYGKSQKIADRHIRHHLSPSLGPATQMTNLSPGFASAGSRTKAQWNQWKTLYKVTISGMYVKDLEFTAKYDYTSKSKVWNAGSAPAEHVWVKETRRRSGGLTKNDFTWVPRDFVGGEDPACLADTSDNNPWLGKCDGAIADDLPKGPNETDDGNIKFTLKDGYINPELWIFKNRTETAVCGENADDCFLNTRFTGGGTFHYEWLPNNKNAYDRENNSAESNIRTETARPFRIDATLLRTPMVVMRYSSAGNPMETHDVATARTAAPASVMPAQWNGDQFSPQYRDKIGDYFYALSGTAPPAENGRAFTGYYLQGLRADGHVEPLLKDRWFYPGDAIDLRTATGSDGQPVRLSNDDYNGPRYRELQLVPTFGAVDTGRPRTYHAQRYLVNTGRPSGDPIPFYAAPGLTVSKTDALTTNPITEGNITYEYTPEMPTVATWEVTERDEPGNPILKLVYLDPTKTLVLKGKVNQVEGAVSGSMSLWNMVNLNAWLTAESPAAADYTTVLASADTRLVIPSGEHKQADQEVINGRATLPIAWTSARSESGLLSADTWICRHRTDATESTIGGSDTPESGSATQPATASADSGAKAVDNLALTDPSDPSRATVPLSAGKVVECSVTFHSAQLGVTAFGLDRDTALANVRLQPDPDKAGVEPVTVGNTPAAWMNNDTREGRPVRPGTSWTLTAPRFLSGKYLDGWKRYNGDFSVGSWVDEANWEDVDAATIEARADKHDIYAAVYRTPVIPWLPLTGGSAAVTWLILGGVLTAAAFVGMAMVRRRITD